MWSRETGSVAPSCVSLLILHTQAESGAYSRNSSRFQQQRPFIYTANRHRVSPQSRLYEQVMQLRTDGVHCRESAGTGSSSQGSSSNGCCIFMYNHAPFPTPTTYFYWYVVSMSDTKSIVLLLLYKQSSIVEKAIFWLSSHT